MPPEQVFYFLHKVQNLVILCNLALVLLCLLFVVLELMLYRGWYPRQWWWRAGGFATLIVLIALFAVSSEKFVYFQF